MALPESVSPAALPVANNESRPLIVHLVFRLEVGGLQNGVVNLINGLPQECFRHAVVCLTGYDEFRERIHRADVPVLSMDKREGQDWGLYRRLYRVFRELRPDIVHTRNLATLEAQLPAVVAGVRGRIHSEHGWDVVDPHGLNRKYQWLRRMFVPFVHRYVPLSRELESYLRERVGVPAHRITRIYNGVDTEHFCPGEGTGYPPGFVAQDSLMIGTVGRMHGVKDQITLVRAFLQLLELIPSRRQQLRLVLIGDGPLREQAEALLREYGVRGQAWLAGERKNVAELLRGLDLFVLPSTSEGISNTILEALATGLPVIATRVGGNPELVADGECGALVPPKDPATLAKALLPYVLDAELRQRHGVQARRRAEREFSLSAMLERYAALYERVLARHGRRLPAVGSASH